MHEYVTLAHERVEAAPDWTAAQRLRGLLRGQEALIRHLREDLATVTEFGDEGTLDFLTGLMEEHEKMTWMLRAVLTA